MIPLTAGVATKISDEAWDILDPLIIQAKGSWRGAKPQTSDRLFLEALIYHNDSGSKWRQLPAVFGDWLAIYNRFRRWVTAGVFDKVHAALVGMVVPEAVRRLFFDSTVVRAHQHAAGAPKQAGGQNAQDLGRSRGGFSTKIHLTCTDANVPVAVLTGPGQESDVTRMEEMADASLERLPTVDEAVGDKGYDADHARAAMIDRGMATVIPNKRNRLKPWPFEAVIYRLRNNVERCINKIKQFRRVATRYDKLAATYRAFAVLACIFIMVR
jgi:transposase